MMIRKDIDWVDVKKKFHSSEPFNHVTIDNFILPEYVKKLSEEFPDYNDSRLLIRDNPLENKKSSNVWDFFPPLTYSMFNYFGRFEFLNLMRDLVDNSSLHFDYGLHGGGWHMHSCGGLNNVHLDYNVHPKLNEQRKLNVIIYLTEDWSSEWNGGLELWSHDSENGQPKQMITTIENVYNRAIIFDTTQNSWHGFSKSINCPKGVIRKSLAAYFVQPKPKEADNRLRALFSPREDQKNDPEIEEIIRKRLDVNLSSQVYRINQEDKK